jgi:23S rRNA (cytidine1920-2'-O)/16S rRNA (cytidine1409-2'-O)-methyltransferase
VARRGRLIPLVDLVARRRPDIDDPAAAIADLSVQVDGTIATNPRALVRADPRVVNLERTNVADLDAVLVPAPLDVVVVDVSRLGLGDAVAQLTERVTLRSGATLLGLVKPMFELRLGELPTDQTELDDACDRAARAVGQAGWTVLDVIESAVRGSRGAVEFFVHATWTGDA